MRGARAGGAAVSLLIFLLSAGLAHADPGFVLAETQARAGDAVHFSITGAEGRVEYEIEVNGRDVTAGSGAGAVSGQFTMPNLGNDARSVTVEADLEDEDDDTTVTRRLQYLGQAVAVTGPTSVQPAAAPAPAAAPEPTPAPQTLQSPQPAAAPTASAPAAKRRSKRRAKQRRKRARIERRHHAPGSGGTESRGLRRRGHDSSVDEETKAKRRPARTAPLFDGIPEPGSRPRPPRGEDRAAAPKAAAQSKGKLSGTRFDPTGHSAAAVLIPALLAFASLVLASAALLRKRRLASEEAHASDENTPRSQR